MTLELKRRKVAPECIRKVTLKYIRINVLQKYIRDKCMKLILKLIRDWIRKREILKNILEEMILKWV